MADRQRAQKVKAARFSMQTKERDLFVLDCFARKMAYKTIQEKLHEKFGIKMSLAGLFHIRKKAIMAAAADATVLGDDLRHEEIRTLELMLAKLMPFALGEDALSQTNAALTNGESQPNLNVMDRVVKINESLRKLRGMDAPTKTENKLSGTIGVETDYTLILGDLTKQIKRWRPERRPEDVLRELGMINSKGETVVDESSGEEDASSTPANSEG